jgi:PEP-CTERM motif
MIKKSVMHRALGALAVVAALAAVSSAHADQVYEHAQHDGLTHRPAEFAPVSFISGVDQDLTIDSIAVLNDLSTGGDLRFVIMDAVSNEMLYASEAQAYADDGLSWKASPSFLFTLLEGHQYLIGAISSVSADWAYDLETQRDAAGPVTGEAGNRNVSSFANPYVSGRGRTMIPLRLTGEFATAVPEPGAVAMMLAGLGVLGVAAVRRRRGAAG